jgi:hypothetical protein
MKALAFVFFIVVCSVAAFFLNDNIRAEVMGTSAPNTQQQQAPAGNTNASPF